MQDTVAKSVINKLQQPKNRWHVLTVSHREHNIAHLIMASCNVSAMHSVDTTLTIMLWSTIIYNKRMNISQIIGILKELEPTLYSSRFRQLDIAQLVICSISTTTSGGPYNESAMASSRD